MKTLVLASLALSFALGVSFSAWAGPGCHSASSLTAQLGAQQAPQGNSLLRLAQGPSEEDECIANCEAESISCKEGGTDEAECGEALNACQQACEAQS
jgi:hypothetical protein